MSLLNGAEVCCVAMVSLVASWGCGAGWDLRKKPNMPPLYCEWGCMSWGFASVCPMTNQARICRLSAALSVGLITALPDYVANKAVRWLLNSLIAGAGVGVVAYVNKQDEDPTNDLDVVARELIDGSQFGPAATWGLFLAVVVLLFVQRIDAKLTAVVTGWLRRRGVRAPHTVLGVLAAALTYAEVSKS